MFLKKDSDRFRGRAVRDIRSDDVVVKVNTPYSRWTLVPNNARTSMQLRVHEGRDDEKGLADLQLDSHASRLSRTPQCRH